VSSGEASVIPWEESQREEGEREREREKERERERERERQDQSAREPGISAIAKPWSGGKALEKSIGVPDNHGHFLGILPSLA
jgi:hypothetical protein